MFSNTGIRTLLLMHKIRLPFEICIKAAYVGDFSHLTSERSKFEGILPCNQQFTRHLCANKCTRSPQNIAGIKSFSGGFLVQKWTGVWKEKEREITNVRWNCNNQKRCVCGRRPIGPHNIIYLWIHTVCDLEHNDFTLEPWCGFLPSSKSNHSTGNQLDVRHGVHSVSIGHQCSRKINCIMIMFLIPSTGWLRAFQSWFV